METINRNHVYQPIGTPRRGQVCLVCKAIVPAGTGCMCGDSALIPYGVWQRRRELIPARVKSHPSDATTAIDIVALVSLAAACAFAIVGMSSFAVVCTTVLMVMLIAAGIVHSRRPPSPMPYQLEAAPCDVAQRHVAPRGEPVLVGVVTAMATTAAPVTGRSCVAYDVTVSSEDEPGALVARDGATAGFAIDTDDGFRVQIPPGHVVVTGPRERGRFSATHEYVKALDPNAPPRDGLSSPYEIAHESIVRVGDRVALHAQVQLVRDSPLIAPYRELANRVYEPIGTVHIEIVRQADVQRRTA